MTAPHTVLEVRGLRKHFPLRGGLFNRNPGVVRAVDDVSFSIARGETLSLVGESGCGKTTTSRCILRAITPTGGEIRFRGESGAEIDVARLDRKSLRPLRRQMQMIFQDPFSSLNPRMTIAEIIGEPLLVNGMRNITARNARVAEPGGSTQTAYSLRETSSEVMAVSLRRWAGCHMASLAGSPG